MRLFFQLSTGLAACSLAMVTFAGGPIAQSSPGQGIEVQPIRFAGIDSEGHLTTPWYYTKDLGGVDSPCGDDCIWDGFGYDTPDSGPNHSPLSFYGPSYCATWSVNDFESLAPGGNGKLSDHAKFAWSWFGDGNPSGSEQCYLVTFTYEDFDDTCAGPPASNSYDGIILDFGSLPTNPGGYYFSNVNKLCQSGLGYQMPMDGKGAYDLQLWNFYDGQNFAFATCGAPKLWHSDNCGTQSDLIYVDDTDIDANGQCTADQNGNCLNIPDGVIQTPFECYNYSDEDGPFGSMVAFLGDNAPAPCIDLSADQFIGGETTTWSVSNGTPNAVVALVYGLQAGTTNVDDVMGYCATFGIQGVTPRTVICQSKFDGAGNASCKKFIPKAFIGKEILMQAAQRDTCPDECVSNILDLVVL